MSRTCSPIQKEINRITGADGQYGTRHTYFSGEFNESVDRFFRDRIDRRGEISLSEEDLYALTELLSLPVSATTLRRVASCHAASKREWFRRLFRETNLERMVHSRNNLLRKRHLERVSSGYYSEEEEAKRAIQNYERD